MQTVPATASLGPAYATVATIGYSILAIDGSVAIAYTTANVVSLGGGFYRVTGGVSAPDAGGIIQWWSNNPSSGGVLLAVDVVEPAPGAVAGETVATAVWSYTDGDRSLSGAQAVNSAAMLGLIQAFVRGRFTINYQTATAIQYNPDGTILQVFDLRDAEGNLANSAQVAVDRVPVFSGGATEPQ